MALFLQVMITPKTLFWPFLGTLNLYSCTSLDNPQVSGLAIYHCCGDPCHLSSWTVMHFSSEATSVSRAQDIHIAGFCFPCSHQPMKHNGDWSVEVVSKYHHRYMQSNCNWIREFEYIDHESHSNSVENTLKWHLFSNWIWVEKAWVEKPSSFLEEATIGRNGILMVQSNLLMWYLLLKFSISLRMENSIHYHFGGGKLFRLK